MSKFGYVCLNIMAILLGGFAGFFNFVSIFAGMGNTKLYGTFQPGLLVGYALELLILICLLMCKNICRPLKIFLALILLFAFIMIYENFQYLIP